MPAPVVDFHVHLFPPDIRDRREDHCLRDLAFGHLYSDPRSRLATAEDALAAMDAASVDHAIALGFGWSDATVCRDHNDYLADVVRRHPDRFTAFGAVQPADPASATREIDRFPSLGLRGIGELMPHLQGYSLDGPTMAVVAEAAQAKGLIVLTHASEPVGHEYSGKGDVSPTSIVGLAAAFPELRIVAAHWGGGLPFYALMPEVARTLSNVYFDSAATTYLYRPEVYRIVSELVGAEHVLFGSDFPLLRPGPMLRKLRALALPAGALEMILGGSAAALLGLGSAVGRSGGRWRTYGEGPTAE